MRTAKTIFTVVVIVVEFLESFQCTVLAEPVTRSSNAFPRSFDRLKPYSQRRFDSTEVVDLSRIGRYEQGLTQNVFDEF